MDEWTLCHAGNVQQPAAFSSRMLQSPTTHAAQPAVFFCIPPPTWDRISLIWPLSGSALTSATVLSPPAQRSVYCRVSSRHDGSRAAALLMLLPETEAQSPSHMAAASPHFYSLLTVRITSSYASGWVPLSGTHLTSTGGEGCRGRGGSRAAQQRLLARAVLCGGCLSVAGLLRHTAHAQAVPFCHSPAGERAGATAAARRQGRVGERARGLGETGRG